MEAKSQYLRGHSHRVAAVSAAIAAELGCDEEMVERVRLAGRLHDVGKIGIRESVLDKPSGLTPEEFAHVKEHVTIGLDILAPLEQLGPVLDLRGAPSRAPGRERLSARTTWRCHFAGWPDHWRGRRDGCADVATGLQRRNGGD